MMLSLETVCRSVKRTKPVVVGMSAAALAIALAGCGGSDTETAATESAATTTSATAQAADCTAASLARVQAGVSTATADYLTANSEVNEFFTGLKGDDDATVAEKTERYLNDNPQVKDELSGIRQPVRDFKERCQ